jgi:DNA primase
MIDWDSDIILVEGVFDAIKAGLNAIPLLGSQLNEHSKLFQKIVKHSPKVYLALDHDAEKKSTNLIKKLLTYGVELYKVGIMPYSDVGEMSRSEFLARKEQAQPVGDFFRYFLEQAVKK